MPIIFVCHELVIMNRQENSDMIFIRHADGYVKVWVLMNNSYLFA